MTHYAPQRSSSRKNASNGFFGSRRSGGFGSGRSGYNRPGAARPVKKFDPSLFIKKVEEQTEVETYVSKHAFADFLIHDQLKENIATKGYKNPTPIQDQAIPILLEGKDIIATANTGTGKTAAFLIPLIHNVLTRNTNRVLIIAPTRELAGQIQEEFKTFTRNMPLYSALCIGGVSVSIQARDLKKDPKFVIGTPGRLIDLAEQNLINFGRYDAIVLDEVDTMLDMGFIRDIKRIISKLPAQRHSLFFSATIPTAIKEIMDTFLHNPVSVSVKTRQSAATVNQDVMYVTQGTKMDCLHELLITPACTKSIVFVRTKRAADRLARALIERGFTVAAIHGDKTQAQRNKSLASFKQDKVKILLATDVVARGIDVDDVSHVINYDLPQTHDDYIHRIGRTGRAGRVGQAITFVE